MRIFNSNVKAVLLYGAETWKNTKSLTNKIQVFTNKCLRSILKIWWPNKISNTELWKRTGQSGTITDMKKWKWIGHTLRKDTSNVTRQALDYNPQGKRKRGRPRNTWRRSNNTELQELKLSWAQAKKAAKTRTRWRTLVDALCSSWNEEE